MEKENKEEQQRTAQQNKALHLYFTFVAEALNDAGYDMRKSLEVLQSGVDVPWETKTVKEYLWRPVQKAQLEKTSTTQLTTKEIDKVFDTLNRCLGEKFGITVPFPSIESIMDRLRMEGK